MVQVPIIPKLQLSKGMSLDGPPVAPIRGGYCGMEEAVGPPDFI